MILYADSLPDNSVIYSDVVIIGAGIIGLAISRRLENLGVSTVIAESGFDYPHEKTQNLASGDNTNLNIGDPRSIRIRQFGGTCTNWGGNSKPLDSEDFINGSWPISYNELLSYYKDAAEILGLSASWIDHNNNCSKESPSILDLEDVEFFLSTISNGFGSEFKGDYSKIIKSDIERSTLCRVLLGLTVVSANSQEQQLSINSVIGMTLEGKTIELKGKFFIIACGGLENARILLLWRKKIPQINRLDKIGKFLAEHPHGLVGFSFAEKNKIKYLCKYSPGIAYFDFNGRLKYSKQTRLGANKFSINYFKLNGSIQLVRQDVTEVSCSEYSDYFSARLNNFDSLIKTHQLFYHVGLFEQTISEESRVELSNDKFDFFGQNLISIKWHINSSDFDFFHWMSEQSTKKLNIRYGLNSIDCSKELLNLNTVGWGGHHMCTTRMGIDPNTSVVDVNCLVHDSKNLFISGSSVFPSGGMANPTLTALALALRLSDYIGKKFFKINFISSQNLFQRKIESRLFFEKSSQAACSSTRVENNVYLTKVAGKFNIYTIVNYSKSINHLIDFGYFNDSWVAIALSRAVLENKAKNFASFGDDFGFYALLASSINPNINVFCFEVDKQISELITKSALVNGYSNLEVYSKSSVAVIGSNNYLRLQENFEIIPPDLFQNSEAILNEEFYIQSINKINEFNVDLIYINSEYYYFILSGISEKIISHENLCIFLRFYGRKSLHLDDFANWISVNNFNIYEINEMGDLELRSILFLFDCESQTDVVLIRRYSKI